MAKKTIYYTTRNCGDGSASVQFFASKKCIEFLEEKDPEGYGMGEGGGSFTVDGEITGISVRTLKEVKEEWSEE